MLMDHAYQQKSFQWADNESLFPYKNGSAGQILQALRTTKIKLVDNAPKGTQLKLYIALEVCELYSKLSPK